MRTGQAKGKRTAVGEIESKTPQESELERVAKEVAVMGISAQQIIATDDGSKWVRQMFSDNQEQRAAAYRLIMYGLHITGYTEKQSKEDLASFSEADQRKIQNYTTNYKPSLDPVVVEQEAKHFTKFGDLLPKVSVETMPK